MGVTFQDRSNPLKEEHEVHQVEVEKKTMNGCRFHTYSEL
jgi:hypothetical protein